MNKVGICSITFRDLSCEQLIKEVKKAGLEAIEWGSDVHVLPNNIERAKEVGKLTRAAGLEVASYGSYYRVGIENEYSFEEVLASAVALGAKHIRVWAGRLGSLDANQNYFDSVVADSKRIAKLAKEKDIVVSYEYHGKTLTDSVESALRLLEAVDSNNMQLYWQPAVGLKTDERTANIKAVAQYLTNVHVFNWQEIKRLPLKEGQDEWLRYLEEIDLSTNPIDPRYFLLEFVKEDSLKQFYADAKVLIDIIETSKKQKE